MGSLRSAPEEKRETRRGAGTITAHLTWAYATVAARVHEPVSVEPPDAWNLATAVDESRDAVGTPISIEKIARRVGSCATWSR